MDVGLIEWLLFFRVGEGENEDLEGMLQNKNFGAVENEGYVANEDKKEFIQLSGEPDIVFY